MMSEGKVSPQSVEDLFSSTSCYIVEVYGSERSRELDHEKIVMIDECTASTNVKGITKLLGHVGWYRKLIPGYVKIAFPITKLLRKDVRFEWTEAYQ